MRIAESQRPTWQRAVRWAGRRKAARAVIALLVLLSVFAAAQFADAANAPLKRFTAAGNGNPQAQNVNSQTTQSQPRHLDSEPTNQEARTASYTYDEAGRLVRVDYGDGIAITYSYDDAGNLLRREIIGPAPERKVFLPTVLR